MRKIKDWIRIKLKKFLDIESLEGNVDGFARLTNKELNKLSNSLEYTKTNLNNIHRDLKNDIQHFQESVNTLHNTVENVVHIGTDVREPRCGNERSWAVICVEGKLNLVKFVSLDTRSIRELLQYLKQYEAGRHCIDSPHAELFYDGLFKF